MGLITSNYEWFPNSVNYKKQKQKANNLNKQTNKRKQMTSEIELTYVI